MIDKLTKFIKSEFLLIYQMGKVASTSIENSLKRRSDLKFHIYHIHSFYSPISYEMFKNFNCVKYYHSLWDRFIYYIRNVIILSLFKRNKRIKIISLVREPVSRNVSMFFQDIQIPVFELSKLFDNRLDSNSNLKALEKIFYDKLNHNYGVEWLDNELKRAFGIDVYKYDFNKEKGFSLIKQGNIELMIIKMEKINELEKEIGEFLDIKDFRLVNENTSEKKWYSCVYKEFIKNFRPSEDYINPWC